MHLKKGVVGQFAVVSVWELKCGLKATSSRFNWSHWGIYAKTFLSDARQPEVEVLHSKAVILPKFLGKSSVLESTHLAIEIC